jgi:hypothetical protein
MVQLLRLEFYVFCLNARHAEFLLQEIEHLSQTGKIMGAGIHVGPACEKIDHSTFLSVYPIQV